jgi:hypothetical protein
MASSNAMSHTSGLNPANGLLPFGNVVEWQTVPPIMLLNLFICFSSLYLVQKTIGVETGSLLGLDPDV